jgi:dTDP-glucose 4,6-dehydratase
MRLLVVGGAGFIGSNFVRYVREVDPSVDIEIMDCLTYAGNKDNLIGLDVPLHVINIVDKDEVWRYFYTTGSFDYVVNFAAESHVDRSISNGGTFVETNVLGVENLLSTCLYFKTGRFLQISTDEVYGSLGFEDDPFSENNKLLPNSTYSASKASADLLVRAYVETHGLDAVVTRCSNNYGCYQYPEKLIPLFVTNLIEGKKVPLYGDGKNIRDWIHVSDHCSGIWKALTAGKKGEVYNFGGNNELRNVDIANKLLELYDYDVDMIEYVTDRKGHDLRYAVDYSKAERELGWSPKINFEEGLSETIHWYNNNNEWWGKLKK